MINLEKILLITLYLLILAPSFVAAHTDISERIKVLDKKINLYAKSDNLYMQRGKLFHLHGDYQKAYSDFQFAKKLGNTSIDRRYMEGVVLLKLDRPLHALEMFNQVLSINPDDRLAYLNRARTYSLTGDLKKAISDYQHALELNKTPTPNDYVEIIDAYVSSGSAYYQKALAIIDLANKKLGMLVQLQSRAIDIHLKTKDYTSALQRVDALLLTLKRKETWLAKKADILLQSNNIGSAQTQYRLALKLISRLPRSRKNVKSMIALKLHIRQALKKISAL